MLKLLGSACILAGGFLVQGARLSERRRQWDTLSDVLTALRRMGEEIRLARTPMPLLLEYLAKDRCPDAAAFFSETAECLRRGESLEESWRREVSRLPLPPEDVRTLEPLGTALAAMRRKHVKQFPLLLMSWQSTRKSGRRSERGRTGGRRRCVSPPRRCW